MKSVIALVLLSFGLMSNAHANEAALGCEEQARKFAQAIIDTEAQGIGWEEGYIGDVLLTNGEFFMFDANIYKGSYSVEVTLDASCSFKHANLEENLSPEDRAAAEQE